MNPPNLAFLQAMMTSMPVQAQPPLQGIAAPSSVAGHAVPQQAAFPAFFLQPPHMQTLSSPLSLPPQFGGQPWVLPAFQTMNATQPSTVGFQSTAGAAPNAGRMAAATKSGREDTVRESIPVGSAPDDEWILVNALRKTQAEGLTPLQGFRKLDKVNSHTTAAWKDYFLLHVERLGPKVFPQAYTKAPSSSTSRQSHPDSFSTSIAGGPERGLRDESTATGSRAKRGPPVEYYASICIPSLLPGVKPKAPKRDLRDERHKFTEEEKIFFIQFLKYRLRRGPVPSKEQLYRELADQVPHRNTDSWKRLWDKECKLPNEIYIAARKRVKNDLLAGPNLEVSSDEGDGHSGDEEDQEEEDEEEDTEPEFEPTTSQTPSSAAKKVKKGRRVRKYRVTEADIQAMAQFIVEKRACDDGWKGLSAGLRWGEFAARPENRKRSLAAWQHIANRRPQGIDAYVRELEAEQATLAEEEVSDPSTEDRSANSQLKGEGKRGAKPYAKRALHDEEPAASEEIETSAEKRPRLENATEVVVLD